MAEEDNKGKKNDTGKNMIACIEPIFFKELGKVYTHGLKKYDLDNWKKFDPLNNREEDVRLKSALLRHLMAAFEGEIYDPDALKQGDKLIHWAQVAFYCHLYISNLKECGRLE